MGIWGGDTYSLQASHTITNLSVDSADYYWGLPGFPSSTTGATLRRIYVPKSGVITAVYLFYVVLTLGTSEAATAKIDVNNSGSPTTITSSLDFSASPVIGSGTGLSRSVSAGDYVEMLTTTPAWVTNPGNVYGFATIYIS